MAGDLLVRNVVCDPTKATIYLSTTVGVDEMSQTVTLLPGAEQIVKIPNDLVAVATADQLAATDNTDEEGQTFEASDEAVDQQQEEIRRLQEELRNKEEQIEEAQHNLTAVPADEEQERKIREADRRVQELQDVERTNEKILSAVGAQFEGALQSLNVANLESLQEDAEVVAEGNKGDRIQALKRAYDEATVDKKVHLFSEAARLLTEQNQKKSKR